MIPERSNILNTWEKITEGIYIDRTKKLGSGSYG